MMWVWLLEILAKVGPLMMSPLTQFITGINIGQILTNVTAFVKLHWKVCLISALAGLQIVTAYGWSRDHNSLKAERASHQADIAAYKQAQKDAQAKADEKAKQIEQDGKIKADEADKSYSALLAQYHASIVRYKTPKGSSGQPSYSELQGTEGGDGPSPGSDLPPTLTITGSDAQICAINTARLQAVHDWAVQLEGTANGKDAKD